METKKIFNKLDTWDQKIILKYNGFGGDAFTVFLKILSFFGRETIWMLLMVYYLFVFYDPLLYSYITSIFLLGVVIIAPIKKYMNRDRPFESLEEIKVLERKPTSRSFPSWHAYNVVSQGLLLAFLLNSLLITIIVLIFAAIVSFSRIQIGVHYPSDVIFGFFIGFIGFILAMTIVAPILMRVIVFFELVIGGQIHYQIINPLLLENILYTLLVIGLICVIIVLALNKRIKEVIGKQEK
ncbi:MAG: phosphatase PAP2 family protein [Candidatus Lokiarchaeota archaeon]|nr:phosphatase PAP2 family protein [Candidatus Lokiarchaeota archaeon]